MIWSQLLTVNTFFILQELTIEVAEHTEGPLDRGVQAGGVLPTAPPSKLRRFVGRHSTGLRIRASPSLQAEELGRVPPGANVAFVEEVSDYHFLKRCWLLARLSDEIGNHILFISLKYSIYLMIEIFTLTTMFFNRWSTRTVRGLD